MQPSPARRFTAAAADNESDNARVVVTCSNRELYIDLLARPGVLLWIHCMLRSNAVPAMPAATCLLLWVPRLTPLCFLSSVNLCPLTFACQAAAASSSWH